MSSALKLPLVTVNNYFVVEKRNYNKTCLAYRTILLMLTFISDSKYSEFSEIRFCVQNHNSPHTFSNTILILHIL